MDLDRFGASLALLRNAFVRRSGGASNRGGTNYVYGAIPIKAEGPYDDAGPPIDANAILVPWSAQNSGTAFVLEFGNGFIRFTTNGAMVTVDTVADWNAGTSYGIGDLANYQGTNYYCIQAHSNQQPPNATYWYQLSGYEYSIPTPYTSGLLQDRGAFCFVQDSDRMLIVHGSVAPQELVRVSNTKWTLTPWNFDSSTPARYGIPRVAAPTNLTATTASTDPTTTYGVTAIMDDLEESLPVTISCSAANTTNNVTLNWTAAALLPNATGTIRGYRIYRMQQGILFYLAYSATNSFVDKALVTPSTTGASPPETRSELANNAGTFPKVCGVFEGRTLLGNFSFNIQAWYASRIGYRQNFTRSFPSAADDSILSQVRGKRPSGIRHFVDLGDLIILADTGEFIVQGDASLGALTPSACFPRQFGYNGATKNVPPVIVGSRAVYIQEQGSLVRSIGYAGIYGGKSGYIDEDLTAYAEHLVNGHTIKAMAYQKTPHSIIWIVRDDGVLIGVTYVADQKILAFHHHDTDGLFQDVCCIQEGSEYGVYVVVLRTVNGTQRRYLERLSEREVTDQTDAVIMDCALSYDGRNTGPDTMTLSGGTTWDESDIITISCSVPKFSQDEVTNGSEIWLTGTDGIQYRCAVIGYDPTKGDKVATVRPTGLIPVSSGLQGVATTAWARAVKVLRGLDHIEGKMVSILANGYVVASPNNLRSDTNRTGYDPITVTGGQITMPAAYSYAHVGLPFLSDFATLDIDTANGETLVDKNKNAQAVILDLDKTQGIWAGPRAPDNDASDPLQRLTELKLRSDENYGTPTTPNSGTVEIPIQAEWNSHGSVFIRQVDPLPMTILAITAAGYFPFKGGS